MQRHFKIAAIAAAVLSTLVVPAYADTQLPTVIVQASGIPYTDSDATYASEVHDRAKIESSGAASLVDYLSQYTTLTVMPNFGNRMSPALDMRGYGITNGFENISVSVDGRRLNEIDQVPPLLGAIPLDAIERIEITKGSGSVAFGDGATAGSIQIYTRPYDGISVRSVVGDNGYVSGDLSAGFKKGPLDLSVSAHNESSDGTSQADPTNHSDTSFDRTELARLAFTPNGTVKLFLEGGNSYVDTRYPNSLTLAQYNQDPSQNGGFPYLQQIYKVNQIKGGAEIALGEGWKTIVSRDEETKQSQFVPFTPYDYEYDTDEILLRHAGKDLDISAGWQDFKGERKAPGTFGNITNKDSKALFAQAVYRLGALALSAGLRRDWISYDYSAAGTNLSSDQPLNAWDVGVNYRFDSETSLFANYNAAFLAPDIDRFFTGAGTFNGFIVPQKSRTFNVGVNRDDANNRLRASVFYARLRNEIFYYNTGSFLTSYNTNLDKTHKYGFELQDTWQLNTELSLSALYTYTRAFIDNATQGGGTYDGKELPGVPHHGVTLGATYQWTPTWSFNANHVWRSSSFSEEDFTNSLNQRQAAYEITNITLRYKQHDWDAFAAITNLFDRKNGLWVRDDAIYPVDFARTFKVGIRKSF